ncbi:helix-turn-helix transcriptional regulator [Pontibacter sp. G13]|uniref:helix-turn-helix transcriptional regulator n=1 Tax=Pontibacter sp. G13 TaxID=3074898 RepID=UPI00288B13C5|nr:helix-turn-helix transcriptional regulator [Pontibacter sp. G13]WNJ20199.1 helix-turn-helix transcriptional regulator [Pontibacter sp. G13]
MASEVFKKLLAEAKPESKVFVRKNIDLVEMVFHILEEKGWTQKDLAERLGKTEPEVSRMLTGLHNFTLRTLAKLEVALETDILVTPLQVTQGKQPNSSSNSPK